MQLKVLTTLNEFEALENEWNHLLVKCASHVPFLRHEYLVPWWKTLGGGEWSQGDLNVVIARAENGSLLGTAPLFYTTNRDGKPALMIIGSIEISDYLDIMVPSAILPDFIDALLTHLDGPEALYWEVLDLYNILEESPTLPILAQAAKAHGWSYKQERIQPAPSITLPSSWEEFLVRIQKKQRHEIRRKLRRAESYFLPVSWYIVEEEAQLDQEIDAFLALMAHDPGKKSFLTSTMRSQMRESIWQAFQSGWLQLVFLTAGSEKVAGYLNFDYENRIWIYNSGINFDYNEISPGWVLLAYIIQWAIDNGREVLDFMRGDEDYKYRFGGINRHVVRVQIGKE